MKPGPDDTATMDRRIDLQLCREMGGGLSLPIHTEKPNPDKLTG
jgi:hypothetical protein